MQERPQPEVDESWRDLVPTAAGRLNLAVLDQGVWWCTSDGLPLRIDTEMSTAHARAVVALLLHDAVRVRLAVMRGRLAALADDLSTGALTAASLAVLDDDVRVGSARAWMERTPLMGALRAKLDVR